MNRKDVADILAFIVSAIPNADKSISDGTPEAWFVLLGDLPAGICKSAVIKVLQEQRFPTLPAPGLIREAALLISSGFAIDGSAAWCIAQDGIYDRIPWEEVPAAVKTAIKHIGAWEIRNSTNPSATRAQFIKIYESEVTKNQQDAIYSPEIKAMIERASEQIGTNYKQLDKAQEVDDCEISS